MPFRMAVFPKSGPWRIALLIFVIVAAAIMAAKTDTPRTDTPA